MKPQMWFAAACAFFGAAIACIELGVKGYVNDDKWDKALSDVRPDGASSLRD